MLAFFFLFNIQKQYNKIKLFCWSEPGMRQGVKMWCRYVVAFWYSIRRKSWGWLAEAQVCVLCTYYKAWRGSGRAIFNILFFAERNKWSIILFQCKKVLIENNDIDNASVLVRLCTQQNNRIIKVTSVMSDFTIDHIVLLRLSYVQGKMKTKQIMPFFILFLNACNYFAS